MEPKSRNKRTKQKPTFIVMDWWQLLMTKDQGSDGYKLLMQEEEINGDQDSEGWQLLRLGKATNI